MFFEVLNKATNQGDIGYAESVDGKMWDYKKIILDEAFHLSYPYVFEWKNESYMIPESFEDLSVRLYKAKNFPAEWEYIGNLLSGYPYVDPSIVRYQDKWWMFVATGSSVLNLYYSDDLRKGWQPHSLNPIIKNNKNISRPAGRVMVYDDKLFRLTQDGEPIYGFQVFAFEITQLTKEIYKERIVSNTPIVTGTGQGWNAAGMHHVDPLQIGNIWMYAVDGRSQ
ncbi:hypothetical protein E1171_13865 [Cytophagales bacterium RKSG123]|nr:hypothetical protein [Xanthovirga aplysinae]MTI31901.1 hypothetical protein [Xanthovirga aplysinae]